MPFVGSILPHTLVIADQRLQQAKRQKDAERAEQPGRFRKVLDESNLTTPEVDAPEAIHRIADNQSEEAHEDRQEHGYYNPEGRVAEPQPTRLDIEG